MTIIENESGQRLSAEDKSMAVRNQVLRAVALLGVGVVLLVGAVTAFPIKPRQEYGIVVFALALAGVALMFKVLMPGTFDKLLRHRDLLVPLGLLILAEAVLVWLMLLPWIAAMLAPSTVLKFWVLSFSISAAFVIGILLQVAYGAWTTCLVLSTVRHDWTDPAAELRGMVRWFLRVFGMECIGWGVLFAGLACAVGVGAAGALPIGLLLIAAGSVIWNLATAALLPAALDEHLRFWEAFRRGVSVSWQNIGRWWPIILVQMILLGFVTFFAFSYTDSKPGSTTVQNKTDFSVNGFWTGGYENECRWYGKLVQVMDAPTLPLISTSLALVFGVLAVAIKLRISEDIVPPAGRVIFIEPNDARV
jgi:hypothetical protein